MMQNLLEYIKKTKSSVYIDIYDPESLEEYITSHGAVYYECENNYSIFRDHCKHDRIKRLEYTKGKYNKNDITHWFMIFDGREKILFIRTIDKDFGETDSSPLRIIHFDKSDSKSFKLTPEQCVYELEKMLKR